MQIKCGVLLLVVLVPLTSTAAKGSFIFSVGNEKTLFDSGCVKTIDYVEKDRELGRYPIALYGHSWGAYCVGAVLVDHSEVKAVVAVSGFNSSAEWMRYMVRGQ